jgi:hypothetical protein
MTDKREARSAEEGTRRDMSEEDKAKLPDVTRFHVLFRKTKSMRQFTSLLLAAFLFISAFGQIPSDKKQQEREAKERAKQEQRERKQQEKREREAYYQRLKQPPSETLPISANLAGQVLTKKAQESGYTFSGYQPAGQIFGTETAQMALFTSKLTFGEEMATRFSIGVAGARSSGEPCKYLAFVISETDGKATITGRIGIASPTTTGWYYNDLTSVEDQRLTLGGLLLSVSLEADEIADKQKEVREITLQSYEKIKIDMSIKEVISILGEGKLLSESETASMRSSEYEWKTSEAKIVLSFENDKVIKKSRTEISK